MLKNNRNLILIGLVIILLTTIVLAPLIRNGLEFFHGLFLKHEIDLPQIKKDEDANFNVLILGIGGGTHDGPNLTDTIILANVNQKKNTVSMVSLPRDLWVPNQSSKINAAYAFGEEKGDQGIKQAREAIEEVTGQKVSYTIVIDFKAFTDLINHVDGVKVNVDNSFQDYEYPISGKEGDTCGFEGEEFEKRATASAEEQLESFPCRYKTLSFTKGEQEMDGETALEYVRSRHGTNNEGSDFARSKRQQKVIAALRDKMLSLGIILNPVKVYGAYDIIKSNINEDIPKDKYDDFIKLAKKMQDAKTKSVVIDAGREDSLLTSPQSFENYRGQWVLVPRTRNGDYEEIHEYITCYFDGNECLVTNKGIATPTPKPTKESSK